METCLDITKTKTNYHHFHCISQNTYQFKKSISIFDTGINCGSFGKRLFPIEKLNCKQTLIWSLILFVLALDWREQEISLRILFAISDTELQNVRKAQILNGRILHREIEYMPLGYLISVACRTATYLLYISKPIFLLLFNILTCDIPLIVF